MANIEDKSIATNKINTKVDRSHKSSISVLYSVFLLSSVALCGFVFIALYTIVQAPNTFKAPSYIEYKKGQNVSQLADTLKSEGYIHSVFLFKLFIKAYGADTKVVPGNYYFDQKIPVNIVAHRFAMSDFNQKQIKITIPEGSTIAQTALIVHNKIPSIDRKVFQELAKGKEGYLFPETYFFYQDVEAKDIITKMEETYNKKVATIFGDVTLSKKDENKIVILASLLEEEGKTLEDKKIIAGILLNRLGKGMPLQVDATINYIKGVADRVYFSDLEIDSPYNTYQNKGLPLGPISSPGLESLGAAVSPTSSKYFYYLTGADGTFHYAKTFEEHVRNKELYLR